MGEDERVALAREIAALLRSGETPLTPPLPEEFGHRMAETITLAQARKRIAQEEEDVKISSLKPQYENKFNFGQLIPAASMMIALLTIFWHFSTQQAIVQTTQLQMSKRLDDGDTRAAVWIPVINTVQKNNDVQDQRIGNLADAVKEIRSQNSETASLLSSIREKLATIEAQLRIANSGIAQTNRGSQR